MELVLKGDLWGYNGASVDRLFEGFEGGVLEAAILALDRCFEGFD